MEKRILLSLCFTCVSLVVFSQIDQENVFIKRDTTAIGQTAFKNKRNTFFTIFEGKPGRAALYSLLVPGAGQAYNKKWFKIPLALGVDGAAGYWVYFTKSSFNKVDDIYRNLLAGGTHEFFRSASDLEPIRSSRRQRMEYAWVYMGIAHLVTVLDAFVDRHLIEFDISEDLTHHRYQDSGAFPIIGISIPLGY